MTEKPLAQSRANQHLGCRSLMVHADMWLELHDGMHAQDYFVHIWRLSSQRRDIHSL